MISAYIDVLTLITKDGEYIPVKIEWSDGRFFTIESYKKFGLVLSHGGKKGILYKITINGNERNLYLDEHTHKWFVDLKTSE